MLRQSSAEPGKGLRSVCLHQSAVIILTWPWFQSFPMSWKIRSLLCTSQKAKWLIPCPLTENKYFYRHFMLGPVVLLLHHSTINKNIWITEKRSKDIWNRFNNNFQKCLAFFLTRQIFKDCGKWAGSHHWLNSFPAEPSETVGWKAFFYAAWNSEGNLNREEDIWMRVVWRKDLGSG